MLAAAMQEADAVLARCDAALTAWAEAVSGPGYADLLHQFVRACGANGMDAERRDAARRIRSRLLFGSFPIKAAAGTPMRFKT